MLDFTIGCGKVNCPSGQEKVPWGATSRRTAGKFICTRATAGEHTVLPHRRQPGADKRFCRCMIHFCFKIQRDISFRKNLCYTEINKIGRTIG